MFSNISFAVSHSEAFESLRAKIYLTLKQFSLTVLVFAYSGTNNAEMLPSELHVATTSSYNIPDVSRFRYLRISQRLSIMFPRDVLDIVYCIWQMHTSYITRHVPFLPHYISTVSIEKRR